MQNREFESKKLTKELQQFCAKETPAIVQHLADTAKGYHHIGEFLEERTGCLFFNGPHAIQEFKNFFHNSQLLSAFTTAFAEFRPILTIDIINYCKNLADYYFSFVLEQESWQVFWTRQVESIKKEDQADADTYIMEALYKIKGAFNYALATEWATLSTSTDLTHISGIQDNLFVLSKITNDLHLQAEQLIDGHKNKQQKKLNDYLKSYSDTTLPRFLAEKNKATRLNYLEELNTGIENLQSSIAFSCLEQHDNMFSSGLKDFFNAIPAKKGYFQNKTNPRKKEAAAMIEKMMNAHQFKSDELSQLITPYLTTNKYQEIKPFSFDFSNEPDGTIASTSSSTSISARLTQKHASFTSKERNTPFKLLKQSSAPENLGKKLYTKEMRQTDRKISSAPDMLFGDDTNASSESEEMPSKEATSHGRKKTLTQRSLSVQKTKQTKSLKDDSAIEIDDNEKLSLARTKSTPNKRSDKTSLQKKSPSSKPKHPHEKSPSSKPKHQHGLFDNKYQEATTTTVMMRKTSSSEKIGEKKIKLGLTSTNTSNS